MIEAYSLNATVAAGSAVPLNNVTYRKGSAVTIEGASTIALNRCGVYKVSVNASSAAAATLQLYKDGIAQPQAQSTGTTPNFSTLIAVDENNTCCPCTTPTVLQVINAADASATLTDFNVVVERAI